MTKIKCTHCGKEIEISEALTKDIQSTIIAAEHKKHTAELAKARAEAEAAAKKEAKAEIELAKKQLASDAEVAKKQAQAELDMEKKRLVAETAATQKKALADQELTIKNLQEESASEKQSNKELREQLSELMKELREERKAKENVELEMQKKLTEEEGKIRESAMKEADEKQRLNLAAKEKTITDLQKALAEAQRKAAQGSQQLQGEVMELDLEATLTNTFKDDDVEPVAKGTKGGDIRHCVKSPRGTVCGVILWEIKRTKNWTDGWIPKLKDDLLAAKANIPVIVTEAMPKQIAEDMGQLNGVWICKPKLAAVLATLLRDSLLKVAYQKAVAQNRGTKEEALYNFVTSHEFVQQVESMIETYREMGEQITKERVAYEKIWSQREKQSQKLLLNTANIIGSMQGHIGQASMPKIKGLELLESGEDKNIKLID